MHSNSEVFQCEFVERPNRFLGKVRLHGEVVDVFIPNPGRMNELMIPGKEVYIREAIAPHRKTDYDMIGVRHGGVLISIDSLLPNRFMKELLINQEFLPFSDYSEVITEPRVYEGRFDFQLEKSGAIAFIEVKSCTLVEDGHARFPDAPTKRGARHLRSLAQSLKDGIAKRAAVVFVIQRPDATFFSPNDTTDPDFASQLRDSASQGVEIYALTCQIKDWNLIYKKQIQIDLEYFLRENSCS